MIVLTHWCPSCKKTTLVREDEFGRYCIFCKGASVAVLGSVALSPGHAVK
jgi:hypothetical protein